MSDEKHSKGWKIYYPDTEYSFKCKACGENQVSHKYPNIVILCDKCLKWIGEQRLKSK